tara:strand:+ start:97 stop:225 length:129 start_codon:yes stop_codon:yes gene_type:complete
MQVAATSVQTLPPTVVEHTISTDAGISKSHDKSEIEISFLMG